MDRLDTQKKREREETAAEWRATQGYTDVDFPFSTPPLVASPAH